MAVGAGLLVWLQVRHGRQVRDDQTRPYVIVDFEFQSMVVMLTVKNIGSSPARDVTVSFDRPIRRPKDDAAALEELAVFERGIPMLAPGRSISIWFGDGPKIFDEANKLPLRYEATAKYSSMDGKRTYIDPPCILDLLAFKYTLVDNDDIHDIARQLKEIRSIMKSWTSEQRLKINSVTQAEVDERRRRWREERLAAREAATSVDGAGSEPTQSEPEG